MIVSQQTKRKLRPSSRAIFRPTMPRGPVPVLKTMRICTLALLLSTAWLATATAGACQFVSGKVVCTTSMFNTGCVGIQNKAGQDIAIIANDSDSPEETPRLLKKGREKKADYFVGAYIYCYVEWKPGKWAQANCNDVVKITKDKSTGGGCGCKLFQCLDEVSIN